MDGGEGKKLGKTPDRLKGELTLFGGLSALEKKNQILGKNKRMEQKASRRTRTVGNAKSKGRERRGLLEKKTEGKVV